MCFKKSLRKCLLYYYNIKDVTKEQNLKYFYSAIIRLVIYKTAQKVSISFCAVIAFYPQTNMPWRCLVLLPGFFINPVPLVLQTAALLYPKPMLPLCTKILSSIRWKCL